MTGNINKDPGDFMNIIKGRSGNWTDDFIFDGSTAVAGPVLGNQFSDVKKFYLYSITSDPDFVLDVEIVKRSIMMGSVDKSKNN